MKKYRIDIFMHDRDCEIMNDITRYFDNIESAEKSAKEFYKDGAYAVFLLSLIECINKYEVVKKL